jgi:hypothetical protein
MTFRLTTWAPDTGWITIANRAMSVHLSMSETVWYMASVWYATRRNFASQGALVIHFPER